MRHTENWAGQNRTGRTAFYGHVSLARETSFLGPALGLVVLSRVMVISVPNPGPHGTGTRAAEPSTAGRPGSHWNAAHAFIEKFKVEKINTHIP